MSNGYEAGPEVLKQAAKGINQTIEELQDVGMVGGGAVGRGFGSLELTQLQMGHTGGWSSILPHSTCPIRSWSGSPCSSSPVRETAAGRTESGVSVGGRGRRG